MKTQVTISFTLIVVTVWKRNEREKINRLDILTLQNNDKILDMITNKKLIISW